MELKIDLKFDRNLKIVEGIQGSIRNGYMEIVYIIVGLKKD